MSNPAALFWDKENRVVKEIFQDQLAEAVKLMERPWPDGPPDYASQVQIIMSPKAAVAKLRNYRTGAIAFDLETTTLKPDGPHSEVICASVCWEGQETIAFPWVGPVRAAMKTLLENPNIGKIGWNAKFEDRWCRERLGITVNGWMWDGMLAAHMLDPASGITATGLKFNAFCYLGQPDYSDSIAPFLDSGKENGGNAPNRIRQVPLPLLLKYCALDSLLEWEVAQCQMKEIGYADVPEA